MTGYVSRYSKLILPDISLNIYYVKNVSNEFIRTSFERVRYLYFPYFRVYQSH